MSKGVSRHLRGEAAVADAGHAADGVRRRGMPSGHAVMTVAAADPREPGDVVVWTMQMDPLTAACVLRPNAREAQVRVTLCGTLLYLQRHDTIGAALAECDCMQQRLRDAGWE